MDIVKELNSSNSIAEAFFRVAREIPDKVVYSQAVFSDTQANLPAEDKEREYLRRTYKQVELRIKKIAYYLLSVGVQAGDRVAIISNSRSEWLEADIAVASVGGISVSVYQSLLPHDIGYILHDSGAKVVFAENEEQVKKLHELTSKEFSVPAVEDRPAKNVKLEFTKVITFEKSDNILDNISLDDVLGGSWPEQELRYPNLKRDDLSCLVYTSGTTGPAKGVMQSHGNHISNIRQAFQAGLYNKDSKLIIVLPLAHSFAKLMGYICFLTPAEALFPAVADKKSSKLNADSLTKDINICGATIFPLVPRMLEKMKEGIEKKAEKKNLLGSVICLTLSTAEKVGNRKKDGKPLSTKLKLQHKVTAPIRRLLKKKLFGDNFVCIISGGAKLAIDVAYFFENLEFEVLEGYGLTETCVATNVNRFGQKKMGTVGPVIASDVEQTLSEEGEILYRGPNITKSYWNRPEATKASWDADGRFHTGDLGSIDQDGFLSITGRKKELIVTSGGKKIAPDAIENKIKSIKFVSQAVLVGEGRPYCAALLTVNFSYAQKHIDPSNALPESDIWHKLEEMLTEEVARMNQSLASFESVKKIELLKEDFSIENGLMTPTMKVKRNEVSKRFKDLIDKFYD